MLDLVLPYGGLLLRGVLTTLGITIQSFLMGFAISSLLIVLRFFGGGIAGALVKLYIDLFRGTPLLVQLLLIYFGLPSLGIKMDAFTSSVIAIGLNSGAYQAEIIRVALKNIPEEQLLVARSLGLSDLQVYLYILMPQLVRSAIPGLTNEFVALLKYSSLASVIGVMELTRVGEYMATATFRAMESYTIVAALYLGLSYLMYLTSRYVERRYAIPGFERWAR